MNINRCVKKGEIYYADLEPIQGSEQGGVRPVLIIQNNIGNRYSPTTIVCVITSNDSKPNMPTHVDLGTGFRQFGLSMRSYALLEQIRTIDKSRLKSKIGEVNDKNIANQIEDAIQISFGIVSEEDKNSGKKEVG